eukprot:tig00021254_g19705.t1
MEAYLSTLVCISGRISSGPQRGAAACSCAPAATGRPTSSVASHKRRIGVNWNASHSVSNRFFGTRMPQPLSTAPTCARAPVRATAAAAEDAQKPTSDQLLEEEFERIPSPFGMVLRPRVENTFANYTEEQLQEHADGVRVLLSKREAAPAMNALSELRFFPASIGIPLIEDALHASRDELVKSHACFALVPLAKEEPAKCIALLKVVLETEEDYNVRAAAAGALGYIENPSAVEALVRAVMEETNWLVQYSAIVALGNCKSDKAVDFLVRALRKQKDLPRDEAEGLYTQALIGALAEIGDAREDVVDAVLDYVGASDAVMRARVAYALSSLPGEAARSALRYLELDPEDFVAQQAISSLRAVDAALAKAS